MHEYAQVVIYIMSCSCTSNMIQILWLHFYIKLDEGMPELATLCYSM